LGAEAQLGRTFSDSEEAPGSRARVFIASDALWRGQLGADPQVVGKSFLIDGESYTLIGVLAPGFSFPGRCDIWMPIGTLGAGLVRDRVSHEFWMIGRLRPDASVAQAQAELDGIQDQLARGYPATDANWRVTVRPLLEEMVGGVRALLWVLFAAVGFVLLIAC